MFCTLSQGYSYSCIHFIQFYRYSMAMILQTHVHHMEGLHKHHSHDEEHDHEHAHDEHGHGDGHGINFSRLQHLYYDK